MSSASLSGQPSEAKSSKAPYWYHAGGSVMGKYHIDHNIPCQDAHYVDKLEGCWQIAVVSDGAGSYENSHYGSQYIVANMASTIIKYLKKYKWFNKGSLPTRKNWRNISIKTIKDLRKQLKVYAKEEGFPFSSLGATVIVMIFSPKGCLTFHVGDGRCAVLTKSDEWIPTSVPFMGDEAGSTVFLTTSWLLKHQDDCIKTFIIRKPLKAIVALSDGMENYSFQCYVPDEENPGLWKDSNTPFAPFLNHNMNVISASYKDGRSRLEVDELLSNFLLNGHPKIAMELDDKTLIFSILNS